MLASGHIDRAELRLVLGVADGTHNGGTVSEDNVNLLETSAHSFRVEKDNADRNASADARIDDIVLVSTVVDVSDVFQ